MAAAAAHTHIGSLQRYITYQWICIVPRRCEANVELKNNENELILYAWVIPVRRFLMVRDYKIYLILSYLIVLELTGVPMHPPWSSVSGTILFRGLSGIMLVMLPEKTGTHYQFRPFFKMAAAKSEISNISEITSCRIMIWESKHIFSWSRNQIYIIPGYEIVRFAGVWSCVHDHTCW